MEQNVICGNNIELLKSYPDNHFDAIVTDPPYGLGKEPNAEDMLREWLKSGYMEVKGVGFMGKEWDSFVPQPIFWKEVFRVLKPGGYVLAFYGTRTYDWGVMAMRLAGFEVRDCIQWVYGCLSDDTEILTESGWVRYSQFDKSKKSSILVFNKDTNEYFFETPERWNEYSIKDTCYRIQSDNTDQIVSRNHRCLVEREGVLLFEFAENLAQELQASIPFLESVPSVSENISKLYKGTGKQKQGLWKRVFFENIYTIKEGKKKANRTISVYKDSLSGVWERGFSTKLLAKKGKNSNLFKTMQRILSGAGMEKKRTQREKSLVGRNERAVSSFSNGRKEPIVERGNNLSEKERLLFGSEVEVCEMPGGIYINGEERWVCSGVSVNNGKAVKQAAVENGVCSSHRPQSDEQRYNELNAICNEQGSQAVRMGAAYSTTLATITPIEYTGVVFCPTVSTGAFVARRNGKIFITGNSGFPKSHNIGKAVDKLQGNEREDLGRNPAARPSSDKGDYETNTKWKTPPRPNITKGKSEWEGWGSALKPANEPIVLARKPLEKGLSIAENVLKWGTGGINIDGCRVGYANEADEKSSIPRSLNSNQKNSSFGIGEGHQHNTQGRFPANLILECICDEVSDTHTNPDCPCYIMDRQSGESKSSDYKYDGKDTNTKFGQIKSSKREKGYIDKGGASRFFYQAKASKSERNRGLEGFDEKENKHSTYGIHSDEGLIHNGRNPENRSRKMSNFHPTVKPVKLMQYLVRLVTPPNGLVLDPFCGSGTTGIACRLEGFNFVGLEREEDYAKIAQARIDNWFGASAKESVPESSPSARLEPPKEIHTQLKFNF